MVDAPAMKEYLVQFCIRHLDFRLGELDSILELSGVAPAACYDREAVNLQRDSAVDPLHHGRMPPLTLQKRELNRFMQSLSEHEKEVLRHGSESIDVVHPKERRDD